ncbi:MAG: VCBS repeat-containing protein [Bacteroidetes bacterium]|nr:VCBS repeat-containing protein [Bacteroidota bacterium]
MVFEKVLKDTQDRYDEYSRLINSLDTDYTADFDAFKGIMNAKQLILLFRDTGRKNEFNDFNKEILLPYKQSTLGPYITKGDANGDGKDDIYIGGAFGQAGQLFIQNNNGSFSKTKNPVFETDANYEDMEALFIDIDNDTDLDLFVVASAGAKSMSDPERQNELFENQGDGTFIKLNISGINTDTSISYGTAFGDFNNDGYCDIVVINSDPTYSALWKNSGGSNNWIKLQLEGNVSNRDGIGSTIKVYLGSSSFIRPVKCGSSYLSQNSAIQTIGVGSESVIDSIIINWPSGHIDVMRNVNVNSFYVVEEGGAVTDINEMASTLTSYKLQQNYPNPFNPSTKIKFSLSTDSNVSLTIFDILGQEVITLVNGNLAAGSHTINFDAANLNSGMYFYRIDATGVDGTNFSSIKKMILMK